MKQLIIFLNILFLAIVLYILWLDKSGSPKFDIPAEKPKNVMKNMQPPKFQPVTEKPDNTKEIYLAHLNKTIKTQYKEIEDCEKEFEVHFGDLLEMSVKKQLEYISDPNNLDTLLDKFSSINFTTPSSAKVIKELSDPISAQVRITEVYHKPGSQDRVDICSPRGKKDILELLYKSKIKKKAIMRAVLDFLENENSTLNYPGILYDQIIELKKILKINGIKESKFPRLEQIQKNFLAFDKKISKIMNEYIPRENATWDYQEEKLEYDFALKLQADIKTLLNQIKESSI